MVVHRRKGYQLDLFMDSLAQDPKARTQHPAHGVMLFASSQTAHDDFMCGARFVETGCPWGKPSLPDPNRD